MNNEEKQLAEALHAATPRATIQRIESAIDRLPESHLKDAARARLEAAAELMDTDGNVERVLLFHHRIEAARRTAREAIFLPLLERDRREVC